MNEKNAHWSNLDQKPGPNLLKLKTFTSHLDHILLEISFFVQKKSFLCSLGPRQTSNFDEQYWDKKNKAILQKKTFFRQYFFFMWIKILNSWLFHLILKSKINIEKEQYCFIALSLYRNIACQNCSSDEGFRVT